MKKIMLLILSIFMTVFVYAQKKQNVYFLKNNGQTANIKDSADFIRVIQEPDSGEVNYNLLEYYIDGKKRSIGHLSSFEPGLIYEGVLIKFNRAGRRISLMNYEKGLPNGMAYEYFDNGVLKKQIEYRMSIPKGNQIIGKGSQFNTGLKLIYQADSLGQVFVNDGNGHLLETTKTSDDELIEEGDYKDGMKNGIWTGKYASGKQSYTEKYEFNNLISGESIRDGKTYTYTSAL